LDYFIEGIIESEDKVIVDISECEMQRWLYNRKVILNNLYNKSNMEQLHAYHDAWHENFKKIAILLEIKQGNRGLFNKLIGKNKTKELYKKEKDKVDIYIDELQEYNKLINGKLSMMRQRLLAMSDRIFNDYI
jgi:hypothetical protein